MKIVVLSPYEAAVSASQYSASLHFHAATEVWSAFEARQISQKRREELLSVLRGRLDREVFLRA